MMININANNPLLAQVHSYSTPGADRNAVQRLAPAPTSSSGTQRFGLTRPGINLAPPYDFESIARPVTNRNGTTSYLFEHKPPGVLFDLNHQTNPGSRHGRLQLNDKAHGTQDLRSTTQSVFGLHSQSLPNDNNDRAPGAGQQNGSIQSLFSQPMTKGNSKSQPVSFSPATRQTKPGSVQARPSYGAANKGQDAARTQEPRSLKPAPSHAPATKSHEQSPAADVPSFSNQYTEGDVLRATRRRAGVWRDIEPSHQRAAADQVISESRTAITNINNGMAVYTQERLKIEFGLVDQLDNNPGLTPRQRRDLLTEWANFQEVRYDYSGTPGRPASGGYYGAD
jgi:hypothetical protein